MCQLAIENGENFTDLGDPVSCNSAPSNDYKTWQPRLHPDCADYEMEWLASGWTWSQIERPFLTQDYCPDLFFYGTMLRHPVELALSRMNFFNADSGFDGGLDWQRLATCVEQRQAGHGAACAGELFLPSAHALWVALDNFQTRMFGGLDVWMLPPGHVNATHRQLALDRLSSFDMVLTLERLDSNQTRDVLRKAFGWSSFGKGHERFNFFKIVRFSEDDVKRVSRLNEHDMILYETFKNREAGM